MLKVINRVHSFITKGYQVVGRHLAAFPVSGLPALFSIHFHVVYTVLREGFCDASPCYTAYSKAISIKVIGRIHNAGD